MKDTKKKNRLTGLACLAVFMLLTYLLQVVDVKPLGVNATNIGFSTLNRALHRLFGVNMMLYTITDWAGLIPVLVVFSFAMMGLVQLIKRRSLVKVDEDILVLGVYYLVIAALYILFEIIPINYRPVLINGYMEASYPSSTTLLVLSVMPTLPEQAYRRFSSRRIKTVVTFLTAAFSVLMVLGRLFSGVHWFTDILGAAILSVSLFYLYRSFVSGKEIR